MKRTPLKTKTQQPTTPPSNNNSMHPISSLGNYVSGTAPPTAPTGSPKVHIAHQQPVGSPTHTPSNTSCYSPSSDSSLGYQSSIGGGDMDSHHSHHLGGSVVTPPPRSVPGGASSHARPSATRGGPPARASGLQHAQPQPTTLPPEQREDLDLKLVQVVGEKRADSEGENVMMDDAYISCVRFDKTGNYLSYATRSGAVTILEKDSKRWEYKPVTSFQAYQAQIDPLNSLEIEPRVKSMEWLPQCNEASFLLTTNEKAIKLWKIYTKQGHIVAGQNCCSFLGAGYDVLATQRLEVPHLIPTELTTVAKCKRQYATEHEFQIHSVSLSSDNEHFLSADDFMVKLWQLPYHENPLTVVNIRPPSMDELQETISCALFNPTHCNLFAFSTSRGVTNLCDLRVNTTCDYQDSYAAVLDGSQIIPDNPTNQNLNHFLASVTDMSFHPNGRTLCTRDYLTLKIWDLANTSQPVKTIPVQSGLTPHLMDLYDNDCIFDRFEANYMADGRHLVTGTYKYEALIVDSETGNHNVLCRGRKKKTSGLGAARKYRYGTGRNSPAQSSPSKENAYEDTDFMKKSLNAAVHPHATTVAVGNGMEAVVYVEK
eukprot:TRINITY_DN62852_c0_g1_i1.p1 TRINITY_DN62852_c0_g1~~TRINITY_DN62852_c0_g1_i1.p1  ORF type:complete len:598 (+),score=66.44 TRINITY_DN62852_c0_g1_i1:343-2136(+)